MKTILIYGATSAIAQSTADYFAKDNWRIILVARDINKLNDTANDLKVRHNADVSVLAFDALNENTYKSSFDKACELTDSIDAVLIAHGSLPDQDEIVGDYDSIKREIQINSISVIALMTYASNYFITKGKGIIAVISSVAGDRGRQSNYVYGASKSLVSSYSQGLRNRLFHKGIAVLTIKPGFVDTPMVAHLKKNFLFAKTGAVGSRIFNAIKSGKSGVIYVPSYWYLIMCIVKSIPESLFMRLKM